MLGEQRNIDHAQRKEKRRAEGYLVTVINSNSEVCEK